MEPPSTNKSIAEMTGSPILSFGKMLTSVFRSITGGEYQTSEKESEDDNLSEAERSYLTEARKTVEYYTDQFGNMVEKAVTLDEHGNGQELYTTYDKDGNVLFQNSVQVKGELVVEPDESSAEKAAEEAQKIASVTLGANPIPFIPEEGYDGEYITTDENGNDIYTVSFEIQDRGVFDDIMYIDSMSGKPHVISIQTDVDGSQTISETVYTLDGIVESQNVITIDSDGNALSNLTTIEELQEFIDRTIRFSVNANTSDSQNRLRRLKDMIDGLKSKTITVTTETKTKTTGANVSGTHAGSGGSGTTSGLGGSSSHGTMYINAKGTNNFPGGYSLINENGPEIVAANGLARIYAHGFPTIAKIPQGAQIFNAEDTAAILGSSMTLPSYADGTVSIMDWIGSGVSAMSEFISGGLDALVGAFVDTKIPPKKEKEEEEKKEEKSSSGSSGGGGSSKKTTSDEEEDDEFWNTIREYIDYGMKKIQYQIDGYQDDITAIERARDALIKPIEEELEDLDYSL